MATNEYNKNISANKRTGYWHAFDFVKGVLIVLVFLGHIIPGKRRRTFPRYVIYAFHMPLFIGISGFLINIEKMDINLLNLFKKYWKRLIFPWVLAVVCYFFVLNLINDNILNITVKSFIWAFCYPYYHLWYVMGFISYLLIFCLLWTCFKNTKYRWIYILFISACISIAAKWELLSGHISNIYLKKIYEMVQNDFRLWNLVFFVFGIYCRYWYEHFGKLIFDKYVDVIRVCMGVSMLAVTVLFYFPHVNVENIMYYVMNGCILFIVLYDCINSNFPRSQTFEFLGRYSLPIYLYHVLGKLFALYLFKDYTEGYYIVSILCFVLGCAAVYFLRNVRLINKIVFGSTTSNLSKRL